MIKLVLRGTQQQEQQMNILWTAAMMCKCDQMPPKQKQKLNWHLLNGMFCYKFEGKWCKKSQWVIV